MTNVDSGWAGPGGRAQAVVLLSCMAFPVLAPVLVGPVQPAIAGYFSATPGVAVLVPALLTVPGLVIGLLSPVAGQLADRFGRVGLLTMALVLYAVAGTAPVWLDSLPWIVGTRFAVGLAEAAILTSVLTLVGDHWSGRGRDRFLGLVTVLSSSAGIVFLVVAGVLGAAGWRTPFWLYGSALLVALLVRLTVREPAGLGASRPVAALPRLDRSALLVPCLVSMVGGVLIATPLLELPFLLGELGITAPAVIGLLAALGAVGNAAGAISFASVSRFGPARLLPVAFGLAGAGIVVLGLGGSAPAKAAGAFVASAGCGLMLPALQSWVVSRLRPEERGRGAGWWTASYFVAQFFLPFLVLGPAPLLGGLGPAVALVGVVGLAVAVASPVLVRRSARPVDTDLLEPA